MDKFIKDDFNRKDLEELTKEYGYIVTCKDKTLSYWGYSAYKPHYQLILCKDLNECTKIVQDCESDNTLSHVNYYPLKPCFFRNILAKKRYSISLRNDWTRIYN